MKKNKRAEEYGIASLVIIVLIIFAWLSIDFTNKINTNEKQIGEVQLGLLNAYETGEKIQFYIDSSAKLALYKSINELSEQGGLYKKDCGSYFGFNLLLNDTYDCTSYSAKDEFKILYSAYLSAYLKQFPNININSYYNIMSKENKLIGLSNEEIILSVSDTEIREIKLPKTFLSSETFVSPVKVSEIKGYNSIIINSCFGDRGEISGASRYHPGIDFLVPKGTPVYSVSQGKVIEVDPRWGRILIDIGNGLIAEYLHLDQTLVVNGQVISQNYLVGYSGGRGKDKYGVYRDDAYGFHLHFGIMNNDLDPALKDKNNQDIVYESFNAKQYINPLCYFDISQFNIDADSLSCGKCHDSKSCNSEFEGPQKWCSLYGVDVKLQEVEQVKLESKSGLENNGQKNDFSSGIVSCAGADINLLGSTDLKVCLDDMDSIKQFMEKNIEKLGFNDLLLYLSWAYQESSCNSNIKGGILRVDSCTDCHQNPIEYQLEKSLKIYLENKKRLDKRKDIVDQDKIVLSLFAYNRGPTALGNALDYYDDGYSLTDAMTSGCYDVYGQQKDGAGNLKCDHDGYAAKYPKKIFDIYDKTCKQLNGKTKAVDYTSQVYIKKSYGTYSFYPSFAINLNYDFNVYNEVYSALKDINQLYDSSSGEEKPEIIENIAAYLAQASKSDLEWSADCDETDKKAFYSFAEQYYLCANSTDTDCYCEINMPTAVPKESKFTIKKNNDNTLFLKGSDLVEEINGVYPSVEDINNLNAEIIIKNDNGKYGVEIDYGEMIFEGDKIVSYDSIENNDNKLFLYKSSDQISFLSSNKYMEVSEKYKLKALNVCRKPIDTVKLCVNTKNKIPVFNNGIIEYKDDIIKFAYKFRDITPPEKLKSLNLVDKPLFLNNSLILTWEHTDSDMDLAKFDVYYSDMDFRLLKKEDILSSQYINNIELKVDNNHDYQDFDMSKPVYGVLQNNIISSYQANNILPDGSHILTKFILKPNKLNRIMIDKDKNRYNYFAKIDFSDNKDYNLLIVPVDKNNNWALDQSSSIYAKPADNMPPATKSLVGFDFKVEKKENNLILSWNTPTKNIDGSYFDANTELDHYDIYYKEGGLSYEDLLLNPQQIAEKTLTQYGDFNGLDINKKYCFYVVPVDNNGNKQFSKKTEEQVGKTLLGQMFEPVCIN